MYLEFSSIPVKYKPGGLIQIIDLYALFHNLGYNPIVPLIRQVINRPEQVVDRDWFGVHCFQAYLFEIRLFGLDQV